MMSRWDRGVLPVSADTSPPRWAALPPLLHSSNNLFPSAENGSRIIVHSLLTFMFLHAQLQALHVISMAVVMEQRGVRALA